jgi:uncharacterized protein (TIGR03435 family)
MRLRWRRRWRGCDRFFVTHCVNFDRPIVDRTGLTGTFNIKLAFTREDPQALGMSQLRDNAPSLFTAIRERLGLKLEATKAPVEVLVIDHAEQPLAN